jgi:adenine deaminase
MAEPLDLLVTNAMFVDVGLLRTFAGWGATRGGRWVYVEEGSPPAGPAALAALAAARTLDAGGRLVAPGLIDAHMHIESSLVTPRRFAEAVVPWGTTAILADPHEVANVAGEEGIRWMIRCSDGLPLRIYQAIPSCVPATSPDLEWTAVRIDAAAVRRLADEPSVIALGEVMDYVRVLMREPEMAAMVAAARERGLLVEGHIPTLRGRELSDYLAWGIGSDHTLTGPDKIREEIAKGAAVMLQDKSIRKDTMEAVARLADRSRVMLVTDDTEPPLLRGGHLSRMVARAIANGLDPVEAWACATVRPARYLGLRDQGMVAPGFLADFLLLDGPAVFPPREVYVGGELVASRGRFGGRIAGAGPAAPRAPGVPGPFAPADFQPFPQPLPAVLTAAVVVVETEWNSLTGLEKVAVPPEAGRYAAGGTLWDPGLAVVSVIARDNSSRSTGLVRNLGLAEGAYAASFAHDSHNLIVVGRDAASMALAANEVGRIGGGLVLVSGGRVTATLRLPILGLISDEPVDRLAGELDALEAALARQGMKRPRPFLMLSLLALSVSPRYKFSDRGIVDVEARALIPPFAKEGA